MTIHIHRDTLFNSLINAMPDLVFQKDLAGRYINCNQAFAEYVGRSREDICGLRPRHLFPPKAARVLEEVDQQVLQSEESLRAENWATDRNGNRALFDTVKTPYYSEKGELLGLIGVSREITKRYEMEEELRRLATIDMLTDVYNRRSLIQQGRKEVSRALRYETPLSVLMIDIDYFKSINDHHGHDAGDEALRLAAQRSQRMLRSSDIFGRYGGEEFLAILPEADKDRATLTAERLRRHQERSHFEHLGHEIRFTLSIGVATLKLDEEETLEALLKRADVALYTAKAQGRNQTVVAE